MSDYSPVMTIQDEVMAFLLLSPTAEEIIAFHASDMAQARLQYLLDANRNGALTDEERAELDEASHINHFMMLLKAKAHHKVQSK